MKTRSCGMLRITVVLLANNAVNMQQFANNAAIIKTVNSAKNSAIAELQKAGGSNYSIFHPF